MEILCRLRKSFGTKRNKLGQYTLFYKKLPTCAKNSQSESFLIFREFEAQKFLNLIKKFLKFIPYFPYIISFIVVKLL